MTSKIKQILLANKAGEAMIAHTSARLEAGKGIVGDRYYADHGTFSEQFKDSPALELTLIEQEQIDAFNAMTNLNYSALDFRRNIVTENIDLNALVDKEFRIGAVTLKGIKLCDPCAYLAKQLGQEFITHMMHKAGLRAQVLVSGDIAISDTIKT